jgi:hypothetical protein
VEVSLSIAVPGKKSILFHLAITPRSYRALGYSRLCLARVSWTMAKRFRWYFYALILKISSAYLRFYDLPALVDLSRLGHFPVAHL